MNDIQRIFDAAPPHRPEDIEQIIEHFRKARATFNLKAREPAKPPKEPKAPKVPLIDLLGEIPLKPKAR